MTVATLTELPLPVLSVLVDRAYFGVEGIRLIGVTVEAEVKCCWPGEGLDEPNGSALVSTGVALDCNSK